MRPPALAPINYFFPEISVKAVMSYDAAAEVTDTHTDLEISHTAVLPDGNFYAQIQVTSNLEKSTNPPYSFDVVAYGLFKPADENAANSFAAVQYAATLLIGATRELLMTMTAKGPWPKFMLPAIVVDKETLPSDQEIESLVPESNT